MKAPALFTIQAVEYWENYSTVCLRRLFPMRSDPEARTAIRQWISTLRYCQRVRAYRNW